GGLHTPSIGFALGVDRCLDAMKEMKIKIESYKNKPKVHIIVDPANKDFLKGASHVSEFLRKNNISCTLTINNYTSWRKMLKNELEYADANEVLYSIIIDDNIKMNKILLKDMKKRVQEVVDIDNLVERLA
ncbi:MAG: His/Gly/Thr/Pro-type tRNA ligase C-terminal domain-containing protein, partial [Thermoplasmata archaeon]